MNKYVMLNHMLIAKSYLHPNGTALCITWCVSFKFFNKLYIVRLKSHLNSYFIISLRRVFGTHKISLTPPLFIKVPALSQNFERLRTYMYELGVSIVSPFLIFVCFDDGSQQIYDNCKLWTFPEKKQIIPIY